MATDRTQLPPIVEERTAALLRHVDDVAPGQVEALYLIGSVAYGDFHEHTSDIDFVAVSADGAVPGIDALTEVHRRLRTERKRPHVDGVYTTWSALRTHPDDLEPMPKSQEGKVSLERPSVIEWSTFGGDDPGNRAVAVRGPAAPPEAWSDPDAARQYSLRNLDEYWNRRWLAGQRARHPVAVLSFRDWGIEWGVLGVARLDFTIATGRVTSKAGGGEHALATFDEHWHPIVHEALRIRRAAPGPSGYRSRRRRRADALSFEQMVIERHRA
jgi:predicted nucleotidyltransferase